MARLTTEGNRLIRRHDCEKLWIEPWGENSLRVRASKMAQMPDELWALEGAPAGTDVKIEISSAGAFISNGKIRAEVNNIGKLFFYNQKGELVNKVSFHYCESLRNRTQRPRFQPC